MHKIIKLPAIIIPILITITLIFGCTNIKKDIFVQHKYNTTTYFHKGVYKSYSPDKDSNQFYYYIFYDENSGYTEDSEMGIGLPFSCVQTVENVKFKFGGSEEPEEIFKIKSAQKNLVTGSFGDDKLLIFDFVPDANPDNFEAIEYMKSKN